MSCPSDDKPSDDEPSAGDAETGGHSPAARVAAADRPLVEDHGSGAGDLAGAPSAPHPGRLLATLGQAQRLQVFAAVVLHGGDTDAVAHAAGLTRSATTKALAALAAVGLVAGAGGAWAACPEALTEAARTAAGMREVLQPEDLGATPVQAAVLRGFVVDGRLQRMPAQHSKRLVVLDFLAQRFEPGVRYREAEVNDRLLAFHSDFATLRRALVDEGFLERRDGAYWRAGGTFEVS